MQISRNQRFSTKDFAYFEIKQRIVRATLEPGQLIVETDLAKELQISRTPLREAIQRLEFEELIIRQPNGRLKVAPISIEEVRELFTVRSLLEGLVTKEATLKATAEDILVLENYTKNIIDAGNSNRREEGVRYGTSFHTYLAKMSQQHTATKILTQLQDKISRYRRFAPIATEDRGKAAAEEHKHLFELIAKREADEAEEAMRKHILNSLDAAEESIKKTYLKENE